MLIYLINKLLITKNYQKYIYHKFLNLYLNRKSTDLGLIINDT